MRRTMPDRLSPSEYVHQFASCNARRELDFDHAGTLEPPETGQTRHRMNAREYLVSELPIVFDDGTTVPAMV